MQENTPTGSPSGDPSPSPVQQPTTAASEVPIQNAIPQQPSAQFAPPVQAEADNSFWTKFFIFINPLASIIVYLLKRDEDPVRAKRALNTGWFAVKFWTIVLFVLFALYFVMLFFTMLSVFMTAATLW